MAYAVDTQVPIERTRAELDALLAKYGAAQRGIAQDDEGGRAVISFALGQPRRHYRLEIPIPKLEDVRRPRAARLGWNRERVHAQCVRARWRAVLLLVKAKLESVAMGVSSPEREFFADLVLADGRRVIDALRAPIDEMYTTGKMPPLLGPAPT